jgi:hypothetical protein
MMSLVETQRESLAVDIQCIQYKMKESEKRNYTAAIQLLHGDCLGQDDCVDQRSRAGQRDIVVLATYTA